MRFILVLTLWLGASIGLFSRAQDLEPRAYSNSPVGLHFLLAGYAHSQGSVMTDPSLPIENVSMEAHVGFLALATTLDVLGKSAKLDLVLPYTSLAAEGLVFDQPRYRFVDGFNDPLLRFSMNFIGAPALRMEEFKDYKQDLIVGASLRVGIPLGQYDSTRLVNIGSNRWSFRPEFGVSKAFGPWTVEVAPSVILFTDNGDFFGGQTRKQDPIYAVQAHLSYSFSPGAWIGLDGAYYVGGRTEVDRKRNNDQQEGYRVGITVAVPVNRYHSVKLYGIKGLNADRNEDFEAVGIAWQYRWGGGY